MDLSLNLTHYFTSFPLFEAPYEVLFPMFSSENSLLKFIFSVGSEESSHTAYLYWKFIVFVYRFNAKRAAVRLRIHLSRFCCSWSGRFSEREGEQAQTEPLKKSRFAERRERDTHTELVMMELGRK